MPERRTPQILSGQMLDETAVARIAAARSFLFVPGDRPDRFERAFLSDADLVVLDLEDGVPAAAKEKARSVVREWLSHERSALVRINAVDTPWFEEDLELCEANGLLGIMLPKACNGRPLRRAAELKPVVALIESAAGVVGARLIAQVPGVVRLAIGTLDLALDLGMSAEDELFDPVRLELAMASRAAGIAAPVDGVLAEFQNVDATERSARRARALGLSGKLAIHPLQVAAIHEALRPTPVEIERAERIVAATRGTQDGAFALDGAMIDPPIMARAKGLLAQNARYE